MADIQTSNIGAAKNMVGTMNPLLGGDGGLNAADENRPSGNISLSSGALGMMQGETSRSAPIGSIPLMSGSATPMQHESSKDWTADVPGAGGGATTSSGADNTDRDEVSAGANLTSLSSPTY